MAYSSTRASHTVDLYPHMIAGESNATYYDYLLGVHALEEGVSIPVQEKIAELIDAQHVQTKTINKQTDVLGSKLDQQTSQLRTVNINLKAIEGAIHHQTSIIDWRLGQVVEQLEGINDSLEALVELAKTPSQIWAYEQFDIARDAYRRRLYDDALNYVTRAIEGHGSQPGYNLDYRFHALKGHICMGSVDNTSPHIVSPEAAESCFVKAAEYAASVSPIATSECLCFAAVAALGFGDDGRTEEHVTRALKFYKNNPEAKFIQAKLSFRHGDIDTGKRQLFDAMSHDNGYVLKALMDGDIENNAKARDITILAFHEVQKEVLLDRVTPLIKCMEEFRETAAALPTPARRIINESLSLSDQFSDFSKEELQRIDTAGIFTINQLDKASYDLYDRVIITCRKAISSAKNANRDFLGPIFLWTLMIVCLGFYLQGITHGNGWFWSLFYFLPGAIVGLFLGIILETVVARSKETATLAAIKKAETVLNEFVAKTETLGVTY